MLSYYTTAVTLRQFFPQTWAFVVAWKWKSSTKYPSCTVMTQQENHFFFCNHCRLCILIRCSPFVSFRCMHAWYYNRTNPFAWGAVREICHETWKKESLKFGLGGWDYKWRNYITFAYYYCLKPAGTTGNSHWIKMQWLYYNSHNLLMKAITQA